MMMNSSSLNDRAMEPSPPAKGARKSVMPDQIDEEGANVTQEEIPAGYETATASVNKSANYIDDGTEGDYSMADTSAMDYTMVNGKKMKKKKKKKKKKGNNSANTSQVVRSGSQISTKQGDQSMHPIEEDKGEQEEEYITQNSPFKQSQMTPTQQRFSVKQPLGESKGYQDSQVYQEIPIQMSPSKQINNRNPSTQEVPRGNTIRKSQSEKPENEEAFRRESNKDEEVTDQLKNMDINSETQSTRDYLLSTQKKPPLPSMVPASTPLVSTMIDLHRDVQKPPPEPSRRDSQILQRNGTNTSNKLVQQSRPDTTTQQIVQPPDIRSQSDENNIYEDIRMKGLLTPPQNALHVHLANNASPSFTSEKDPNEDPPATAKKKTLTGVRRNSNGASSEIIDQQQQRYSNGLPPSKSNASPIPSQDQQNQIALMLMEYMRCEVHPTERIKYYCREDGKSLCPNCVVDHAKHDFIFADESAAFEVKQELRTIGMTVQSKQGEYAMIQRESEQKIAEVELFKEQEMRNLRHFFQELHKALDQREQQIQQIYDDYCKEFKTEYMGDISKLNKIQEQLGKILRRIDAMSHGFENAVNRKFIHKMLMSYFMSGDSCCWICRQSQGNWENIWSIQLETTENVPAKLVHHKAERRTAENSNIFHKYVTCQEVHRHSGNCKRRLWLVQLGCNIRTRWQICEMPSYEADHIYQDFFQYFSGVYTLIWKAPASMPSDWRFLYQLALLTMELPLAPRMPPKLSYLLPPSCK